MLRETKLTSKFTLIYLYIYIEREREREIKSKVKLLSNHWTNNWWSSTWYEDAIFVSFCCVYVSVYMYVDRQTDLILEFKFCLHRKSIGILTNNIEQLL